MTIILDLAALAAYISGLANLDAKWRQLTKRLTQVRSQHRTRARIRRELEGYTRNQLGDLGLSPSDIPDVAAGTYGSR